LHATTLKQIEITKCIYEIYCMTVAGARGRVETTWTISSSFDDN